MYGILRPRLCGLGREGADTYRRLYCGLCSALGTHFGQLCRLLLSHDAALYATAADAVMSSAGDRGRCICPVAPWRRRSAVIPASTAMGCAAAVQVLLADQVLADKAADDGGLWRLPARLLRRHTGVAEDLLGSAGIDATAITGVQRRQLAVENRENATPAQAAEPTTAMLRSLLGQLPELPGADPAVTSSQVRERLGALGGAVGTVVYLVDALRDLARDQRRGSFNPCLVATGPDGAAVVAVDRVESCRPLLEEALATIRDAVPAIPWQRHARLLASTLCLRLPAVTRRHLQGALSLAGGQTLPATWPGLAAGDSLGATGDMAELGAETSSGRRRWCDYCDCYCDCCDCSTGDGCSSGSSHGCDCCSSGGDGCHCGACDCGGCDGCDCGGCDCPCDCDCGC